MKTQLENSDNNICVTSGSLTQDNPEAAPEAMDFEAALSATGFGKFNLAILAVAIPSAWASLFETTTMSYVFPAAQCDLQLTMENKGVLNGATYLGMIASGVLWGYLSDTLGRKKLMIVGTFFTSMFLILSGFSQSYEMLLSFKFMGGFMISGPFLILTTYVAEFHSAKYRARILLIVGMLFGLGSILLPLLALAIFPLHIQIPLFSTYELHAWNVYLFLCALPSLATFFGMMYMPESPKFLMTMGQNDKALEVFRKVYSYNTGKPIDTFPVMTLVDELNQKRDNKHDGHMTTSRSKMQAIREGWQQITPLFFAPYRSYIILLTLIQLGNMTARNTLRLWLPQIFIAINNYEIQHNGSDAALCDMLEMVQPNITVVDGNTICQVDVTQSSAYINSVVVSTVTIGAYVIAGSLINALGKKTIAVTLTAASAACAFGMYFSQNTVVVLTISSIFISAASVINNVIISVVVDAFPTTLRAVTVAIVTTFGRIGALGGNILFPIFLQMGCLPPFIMIGGILAGCTILSILIPKTDLKPLE